MTFLSNLLVLSVFKSVILIPLDFYFFHLFDKHSLIDDAFLLWYDSNYSLIIWNSQHHFMNMQNNYKILSNPKLPNNMHKLLFIIAPHNSLLVNFSMIQTGNRFKWQNE